MSYDVAVYGESHNYTSNITRMLYDGDGFYWPDYDGQRAAIVEQRLGILLRHMEADPARFEQHNPENGWGDFRSCMDWLRRIKRDAEDAVRDGRGWETKVRVSW